MLRRRHRGFLLYKRSVFLFLIVFFIGGEEGERRTNRKMYTREKHIEILHREVNVKKTTVVILDKNYLTRLSVKPYHYDGGVVLVYKKQNPSANQSADTHIHTVGIRNGKKYGYKA